MSPAIDPRIRERRAEVTRARGRRRLRLLAALVAVGLLVAIAFGVSQSPLLAVDEVVVTGTDRLAPDEIRDASGIADGASIIFADLGAASRSIEELPWVASARVQRDLPRTIRIDVVEREPVGYVARPGGSTVLVDAHARLLEVVDAPGGLPAITGLDVEGLAPGDFATPAQLAGLLAELPAALRDRVIEVVRADELGEPGATLVLADGPEVRLGTIDAVPEKASAALAVLAELGERAPTYVDVSVPRSPATDDTNASASVESGDAVGYSLDERLRLT